MIIAITGMPSSGKSFLARALAKAYGFPHVSIGDMRRLAAEERGLSLAEYNALGEDTDSSFDAFQRQYGLSHDDFVIDGRLSAFFIPHAIKIFVDADERVRAQRMLTTDPEHRRIGEQPSTLDEALSLLRTRVANDTLRYQKRYGHNPYDAHGYDIVFDTTHLDKSRAVEKLRELISSFA